MLRRTRCKSDWTLDEYRRVSEYAKLMQIYYARLGNQAAEKAGLPAPYPTNPDDLLAYVTADSEPAGERLMGRGNNGVNRRILAAVTSPKNVKPKKPKL